MPDVLHRTTKELRRSVNETLYPLIDWIHSPDLSAVVGVSPLYWTITGDTVSEMSVGEKAAVDATRETARLDAVEAFLDDTTSSQGAYNALLYKEINKLRILNGDTAYTLSQLKTALRSEAT